MDFLKDAISHKMQEFVKDKFGMDLTKPSGVRGRTPPAEQLTWMREQAGDHVEEALSAIFSNDFSSGISRSSPLPPGAARSVVRSFSLEQISGFLHSAISLVEKAADLRVISPSQRSEWLAKVNIILRTIDNYLEGGPARVTENGHPQTAEFQSGAYEATRLQAEAASRVGYRGPLSPNFDRNPNFSYRGEDFRGYESERNRGGPVQSGMYPHIDLGNEKFGGNLGPAGGGYYAGGSGIGSGYNGGRGGEYGREEGGRFGSGFETPGGFQTMEGVGGGSTYERETGRRPMDVPTYQRWGGEGVGEGGPPTGGGFGVGGVNAARGDVPNRGGNVVRGGVGSQGVEFDGFDEGRKTRGETYGGWKG